MENVLGWRQGMTYKQAIKLAMEELSRDPRTVFLGYNTKYGGRAGGALVDVPEHKLIEMPLAEALMSSVSIGLSLEGKIPVLYFERMDFMTIAMDAIVNHLDKLYDLSLGLHRPSVIIRAVVGNNHKPLFTGVTHTQDLSLGFQKMLKLPVVKVTNPSQVEWSYRSALGEAGYGRSTIIVEYKDLY